MERVCWWNGESIALVCGKTTQFYLSSTLGDLNKVSLWDLLPTRKLGTAAKTSPVIYYYAVASMAAVL